MKNIIKFAMSVVAIILVIDFVGFLAWAMSGQMPVDSFYVGAITKNVLQALFF